MKEALTNCCSRRAKVAAAIALVCCTASQGQDGDNDLAPVHYDVYLKKENPLYPFGVNHPCGPVLTLQGNKLPMNVQGIELLWAFEVNSMGEVQTRWPLPIDATPLAIDGNRLIIHQFNAEEIVVVTVKGNIGIGLSGPPKVPGIESKSKNLVDCPVGVDDDSICSKIVDVATGALRVVAYPRACT